MSDQQLIQDCLSGRHEAWKRLVRDCLPVIMQAARRTLGKYTLLTTEADVEDVAGEVFEALVKDDRRMLRSIGPPYNLRAWMGCVARRKAIDLLRRKEQPKLSLDAPVHSGSGSVPLANWIADKRLASEELEEDRKVDRQRLQEALNSLKAKERMLVKLFYFHEKSYQELSQLTHMPVNSIGPTLTRALRKMHKRMEGSEVA